MRVYKKVTKGISYSSERKNGNKEKWIIKKGETNGNSKVELVIKTH